MQDRNIILMKLHTGEEVLSEVVDESDGSLSLIKPFVAVMRQDEYSGKISTSLLPYMVLAHSSIVSLRANPLAVASPSDDALRLYYEATNESVIKVSQKNIIV